MPTAPPLLGIGATREDWDQAHDHAAGFTLGLAYGPLIDGQPTYSAVIDSDGRIYAYSRDFESGTTQADRESLIEAVELPPDAVQIDEDDQGDCLVVLYESDQLKQAMSESRSIAVAYVMELDPVYAVLSRTDEASATDIEC